MRTTYSVVPSPVGDLTLVAEEGALVRLTMESQRHAPSADLGERDDPGFASVREQLGEYFAGERTAFDVPLAPHGDPDGQTRTYGELARALGDVHLSQAVGSANARNPIGIIVPCHRVIGSDGSLVGYAGGLDRKRFLLTLEEPEAARADRLF